MTRSANGSPKNDLITDFDSFIYLAKDSSLRVSETINIYFGQNGEQNVVRSIPLTIELGKRKHNVYIEINSVTCDGRTIPHEETIEGDNLQINLGRRSEEAGAQYKFEITYTVRGAARERNGKPEIYWNVTGNQWPVIIERASAAFRPPNDIEIDDLIAESFVGSSEASEHALANSSNKALFFQAKNLRPGKGLIIVVYLPKDAISLPSATSELGWTLAEFISVGTSIISTYLVWLLIALVAIALLLLKFYTRRRPSIWSYNYKR